MSTKARAITSQVYNLASYGRDQQIILDLKCYRYTVFIDGPQDKLNTINGMNYDWLINPYYIRVGGHPDRMVMDRLEIVLGPNTLFGVSIVVENYADPDHG